MEGAFGQYTINGKWKKDIVIRENTSPSVGVGSFVCHLSWWSGS